MEFKDNVKSLANSLLLLRKIQDSTQAEFVKSLGGLSMQELNVLNTIGDNKSCIMSDIAKNLSLSLSSVTVIVEKLVKSGLVERVRSEEDRRIVYGKLTSEGAKIYQSQIDFLYSMLNKILEKLSLEEQSSLTRVVQKIAASLV